MDKDTFIKEIYNKCRREEIESFLIENGICYVRNNFIDKIYNNAYDTKFNYLIFIENNAIDLMFIGGNISLETLINFYHGFDIFCEEISGDFISKEKISFKQVFGIISKK